MVPKTLQVLSCVLGFVLLTTTAQAQVNKAARKRYPHFVALREMADTSKDYYDTAVKVGLDVLQLELDEKSKKYDTLFIAGLSRDLAVIFEKKYDYALACEYFKLSASCYEKIHDLHQAGKSMSRYMYSFLVLEELRLILDDWGPSDSSVFDRGKKDTTYWFTAAASSLVKTGDTLFVEIKAGRAQGIKTDSKFDVFTTFDTFANIYRRTIQGGTGFITEINDFTSKGYIVLFDDFKDTVFDNDAFEVKVELDKDYISGQIAQLGAFNIRFKNHTSDAYYIAGDGNLTISSARYELPLKLAMLDGIKDAVAYYNDIDTSILQSKIESGRFGGLTYAECFNSATVFDIEMFLDYVNTYPSKYINREFNFAEVFATWAINDCPTGNAEMRIIDSVLTLSSGELMQRQKFWSEYYRAVTNADSVFLDRIENLYELDRPKKLEQLEKMKLLVQNTGNEKSDSFYTIQLVFESYSNHRFKEALAYADALWPRLRDRQKMLVALYKGILYSQLDQNEHAIQFLDSALAIDSNYYYARGYKGWNLIKMGKIKLAYPHCLFAFEWDSAVSWTNINLAHALILKGQYAEAHRLYKKSFEYMSGEWDFYTGLSKDFDYFIENGLNETEFRELKKYYTDYYNQNWKYTILGDSLKSRAIKLKEKDQYREALALMQASTLEFSKVKDLKMEKIHSNYRWIAYLNYKIKDFKASLKYYQNAAELTQQYGLGDDNLILNYSDISNIYDWLNDTLHQMEYRARASSLEVALREKRDEKKLFMLLIGPGGMGKNDSFAVNDAIALRDDLKGGAELQFDQVTDATFTGKDATIENVRKALDSAIYSLGENDVFLFYFTGFARNTYGEGIQLTDGVLPISDLYGYLGQISAGRQVHIADCNGLNWREWYQRGNISLLADEKRSLVFMGLKNSRIEESESRHSVLSSALLKGFKKSSEDGTITATEWVSAAATVLFEKDQLFAVEMQTFGHDFIIGKQKVILQQKDTFAPQIELFGAKQTRGDNISLVSNKGVNAGRIYDDNKIVFAEANNISLSIAANGRFELPKELIGVKDIRIVAVDEFGNRAVRNFIVTQVENTSSNEGTRYAYLFASGNYEHWTDLANPLFDAQSISDILASNYGYSVQVIPDPSRTIITEKLDYLRRFNFKTNDQLFVFFAGHGLYDSVWGGFYVCPESKKPEEDKYYETYYPQQRIADLLDGCKAKNVFLVMDVCFGGKMFDKHDNHEIRSVNDGNEISADEYIKRQLEIPCRQFLTSGGNNYVADGVAGSHSPFASRLIAALEEAATSKDYITASQVMDYLWTMRTVGNDKKSFPRYGFFGGDKDGEYVLRVTKKIRNSAVIAGI